MPIDRQMPPRQALDVAKRQQETLAEAQRKQREKEQVIEEIRKATADAKSEKREVAYGASYHRSVMSSRLVSGALGQNPHWDGGEVMYPTWTAEDYQEVCQTLEIRVPTAMEIAQQEAETQERVDAWERRKRELRESLEFADVDDDVLGEENREVLFRGLWQDNEQNQEMILKRLPPAVHQRFTALIADEYSNFNRRDWGVAVIDRYATTIDASYLRRIGPVYPSAVIRMMSRCPNTEDTFVFLRELIETNEDRENAGMMRGMKTVIRETVPPEEITDDTQALLDEKEETNPVFTRQELETVPGLSSRQIQELLDAQFEN
ncbi:MAG: hypothetical protein AAB839_02310 [Patescibacteria group bacterium]